MRTDIITDSKLHNHDLHFKNKNDAYICDGCKDHGCGERFQCTESQCRSGCDFHKFCARPEDQRSHPFFRRCLFRFRTQGGSGKHCDACSKPIRGFLYHCSHTSHERNLHPCCVNLQPTIRVGGIPGDEENIEMYLRGELTKECLRCGLKKLVVEQWKSGRNRTAEVDTWGYATRDERYNVHVHCVKGLLAEYWDRNGANSCRAMTSVNLSNAWLVPHQGNSNLRSKFKKFMRVVKIVASMVMSVFGLADPTHFVYTAGAHLFTGN